jgi:rhodanese-related sulfurtransferase
MPPDEIQSRLAELPRNGEIVAHCSNGIRAGMAYRLLTNDGFSKTRFLDETVPVRPDGSFEIE